MTVATHSLTITRVDYRDPDHARDLIALLDGYARDAMGGGAPLSAGTRAALVPALADMPHAFSLLAYVDDRPAGLANCFVGFSTFAAQPLVNIHDVFVDDAFRGTGIGRALFGRIEDEARALGACKVTLEVLSGNAPARALYASLGYGDYALDPEQGTALFWQKRLDA